MFELSTLFFLIGYLFIFLGIVGAVVPVLPGPLFIWLGVFIWAWADGFAHIGWPTLLALAILTVISWGADLILSLVSSRRSGAGWRSIGVSILGGLFGALLLSSIPIIGAFIGAIVGSLTALWLMECRRAQESSALAERAGTSMEPVGNDIFAPNNRAAAMQAVKGYIGGFLLAMVVEFIISVMMLSIFAWQAFL